MTVIRRVIGARVQVPYDLWDKDIESLKESCSNFSLQSIDKKRALIYLGESRGLQNVCGIVTHFAFDAAAICSYVRSEDCFRADFNVLNTPAGLIYQELAEIGVHLRLRVHYEKSYGSVSFTHLSVEAK